MRIIRTLAPAVTALALAACSTASDPAPGPAPAPAPQAPMPAAPAAAPMEAVYTAAQADDGEKLFADYCSACHGPSEFQGGGFLSAWGGRTAYDLHGFISQNMPEDQPGILKPGEYADLVAYIFELNRFPAGGTRLSSDAGQLRQIRIPRP